MKKIIVPVLLISLGAVVLYSCKSFSLQNETLLNLVNKEHKVLYFNPEIYPNIEEIKSPTYQTFFDEVSNKFSKQNKLKYIRLNTEQSFDSIDIQSIKEICKNNEADFAVVPKIKYFKIGIGKYVFSNQVEIGMKVYDAKGTLLVESSYNTFKRNKRILGNTANSIKKGTNGAMNDIIKEIRNNMKSVE